MDIHMKRKNNLIPVSSRVILLVFILLHNGSYAQKFVQDTLEISFNSNDLPEPVLEIAIDSIIDLRNKNQYVLGTTEKKKYLIIPVDLLICTKKPLSQEISEILPHQKSKPEKAIQFKIVIDEFILSRKGNSLLYPCYSLNAAISLYKQYTGSNSAYFGQLLYELKARKSILGDNLKKDYESVLQRWQREFIDDLSHIQKDGNFPAHSLDNFRRTLYHSRPINMLVGFDGILSLNGKILDNEIYFSHREARKRFFRSGGYNIRYRNTEDFESIEFGLSNDYLHIRFNPKLLLRWKSQIMFGVNRWKDIQTTEHKLYDAIILDYSISQSLIFNPLDKRSILFGIGLMENVFYVYSKSFQFQVGPLLHLGLKL
jgi:hypothetical protein